MEFTMGLFLLGALFIFGAIIGSFLNVVILRHNTGKSLAGRSGCMVCGGTLKVLELVPVLSFIFQRGKCTTCKSRISWQYILVELTTAALFTMVGVYSYIHFDVVGVLGAVLLLCAMSLLSVMIAYDFKHTILPDLYTYGFTVLAIVWSIITSTSLLEYGSHVLGGFTTVLPIFAIWYFSRGRAMGFGDVKLSVGIGIFLGPYMGISALWYGFVIGAIYGLVLMAMHRAGAKSEVAFGPFLILGFLLGLFTQVGFLEVVNGILML